MTAGQEKALETFRIYLEDFGTACELLIMELEADKHIPYKDAVCASGRCGADWKVQAHKKDAILIDGNIRTRIKLIDNLILYDITNEEAQYSADQNGFGKKLA